MNSTPHQSPEGNPAEIAIGPPLRVAGRLTVDDYLRLAAMYGSGEGKWQKRILLFLIAPAAVLLVALSLRNQSFAELIGSFGLVHYLLASPLLLVVALFWWVRYFRRKSQEACDRHEGIYADQQVEFSDEGVLITTKTSETRLRWDAFSRYKSSDEYLALHLKDQEWATVNIAKRWFPDEQQWSRLLRFVGARLPEC